MAEQKYSKHFNALLSETPTVGGQAFDFKSLLQDKPKTARKLKRITASGVALIFDLNGELIAKAKLKNLTTDGLGFEVPAVNINTHTDVQVVLGGKGRSLGVIDCYVKWVETPNEPRSTKKSMGVQVSNHDARIKTAFRRFVEDATRAAANST